MKLFYSVCRKHGIISKVDEVFAYLHEFPENKNYEQLRLF